MTLPTLIVEIGFTVGASTSTYLHLDDSARGKLDTGKLAPDSVWTDVTADVLSMSTLRGAQRVDGPVLHYDAGTCVIKLDDRNRYYDPDNLSGPYVSGGVTQVTPMRALRVRATHNGTTYDLWRGYADSWTTEYLGQTGAICTLAASDAVKVLSAYNRVAGGSVGAGDDSGARISRILDSASWSATDRIIAVGDSTLQATTLDGAAWTEMQLAQDTEIGELYIDGGGRVVFRNRQAIFEDSRSANSQATFGDGGGSELPYQVVTPTYDDTQLFNKANITRVGGSLQTNSLDASTSISDYLTHVHERTDLIMQADSVALDYANFIVYQSKDPERRFSAMTLGRHQNNATEQLLFAQMLGRQIGDRITVKRRPPGGGSAISREVFVRGIAHEYSDMQWKTTFVLQSATKYSFLTLDHATLGKLDSNALAF